MGKKRRITVSLSEEQYRFLGVQADLLGCSRSLVLVSCYNFASAWVDDVASAQRDFDTRDRPVRRNTDRLEKLLTLALMSAHGGIDGAENETLDMFPVDLDLDAAS